MTDQELLILASKAAGFAQIDFLAQDHWANVYDADGRQSAWNPLTDDGDALRLAVKCRMIVDPDGEQYAIATAATKGGGTMIHEKHSGDPLAATRRAIVRSAAEIGKTKT